MAQSQTSTEDEVIAGRYRVEQLLGRGGMGAVYKVCDLSTGELLALKRLNPEARAGLGELLEREYCTLARLRHPRIVQVFEFGIDRGSPFYTMELLAGADLSHQAPMEWRKACTALRDAASTLGVLHARQLVHRDLNPRNLWQTPDGRLKLLDFGALTSYGVARELVGTPPFIAPEALQNSKLDQRTDLFALGALGYWLLTGTHAFRATALSELPSLWRNEPLPPSRLAQHVADASRDIPAELDRVILSLLRVAPDERPRSTADLVNLLDAIAGLKPDAEAAFVQGYLESGSFVGREREQRQFSADLSRADRGKPQALLIEAVPGMGRTRLLEELTLHARISGAIVATAPNEEARYPLDTAIGLAKAIVKALPIASRSAAGPDSLLAATLFSHFAASSRASGQPPANLGNKERTTLLISLAGWVLQLAKDHTLAIMVDDFERADQDSQAFFATLARAEAGHRLLITCTSSSGSIASDHPAVRTMRLVARSLTLPPLTEAEIRDMLRSVFGEALYLDRMAARLHVLSGGVPSHALMLARHLVRSGAAQYAEGAWSLPRELPIDLPATLDATIAASLRDLPADARRLACVASVADPAPVRRNDLAVLAGASTEVVEGALTLLLRRGVLTEREEGLRVATPALAESLAAELADAERTALRDAVIRLLRDQTDLMSQVRCALHLLRARKFGEAEALFLSANRRILGGDQDQLRALVPLHLEALRLLRAEARDAHASMPVLNVLAVAGNLVKRSLAVEHGDEALRVLAQVLRFDLARRLKPWLGGRLSFLAALAAAAHGLRRRKIRASALEVLTWFASVTGYTFAPATACLDYRRVRQHAGGLEPLLALGLERVSLVHRFALNLALCLEDRRGETQLDELIARFTDPKPVPGLPDGNRLILLVSCYYANGYGQAFACDARALDTAQRIESVSPIEAIKADHLRALYHAYRGEPEAAAIFEKRLERRSIELGNVFQEELLAPRQQARITLWTLDAASTRRAARSLAQLAEDTPSFAAFARWACAADLVLRRRYQEALACFEPSDRVIGDRAAIGPRLGLLARIYNGLGDHAQAREVALAAMAELSERDREFVILNLGVEVELALAEAGSGDTAAATNRLRALAERHENRGRLVCGYIEAARFQVALRRGELDEAEHHLAALDAFYRPTRIPSLLLEVVSLREQLRSHRKTPALEGRATWSSEDAHFRTRFELLLQSANDNDQRTHALRAACEMSGVDEGFLLCVNESEPSAWLGETPRANAVEWAKERLAAALEDDDTVTQSVTTLESEVSARVFRDVHHSLTVLWRSDSGVLRPVGALVLASRDGPPTMPPLPVLQLLGPHLPLPARSAAASLGPA